MPVSAELGPTLRVLERWILPAECLLCRRPADAVEPDALVCRFCRVRWRRLAPPLCDRCGQPVRLGLPCRICQEWPPALARTRSAVWLDGTAREVVHRLKYDGWWRVTDAMADAMRGLEPLTAPLFLIPVPLAPTRLRGRGYNQSARLAAALGRRLGCPVREDALTRTHDTRTQTALTPEARRANVAGVFRARPVHERGTAVLVDDVFTTGATLSAAAAALADAGMDRVEAVTFARAVMPVG